MQTGAGNFLRSPPVAAGWGVLIPYVLFVLWALGPRLDNVLSFGGDDGFELCKAALLARLPDLGPRMWNDQPWLHTLLNAMLFRLVGEHAALPRMFSLISLGALLGAMIYLSRRSLNFAGGLALGCFLLAGEGMPNWSVAAMLELPAISWAMVADALAATPPGVVVRWRLVSTGTLLALACHVKFTALLVLPALLVMVWAQTGRRHFASALVWAALAFVTTFSVLVKLSPSFDLEQLLTPHLPASSALVAAEQAQFRPQWGWVLGDPAPLMAALFAWAQPAIKRCKATRTFTLVLLGTAVGIALCHRPWWRYYLIHLQVPLAMLGAVGVTWLSRQLGEIWRTRSPACHPPASGLPTTSSSRYPVPAAIMGAAAVLALWCGFALPRLMSALEEMSSYPTGQSSQLVSVLRRYQDRIQWCYTDLRDVAFHGRVLIPPELIVVSRKRFWHGDLDERRLWNWVRLYAPEAIVVSETYRERQPACASWLKQGYVLCAKEHGQECWLASSLTPDPLPQTEGRLERFGL